MAANDYYNCVIFGMLGLAIITILSSVATLLGEWTQILESVSQDNKTPQNSDFGQIHSVPSK